MDNISAAEYLLKHLPHTFEGVVYLDRDDRQMILLRSSGRSMQLSQCGLSPEKRFTFYDQVHTTGMDIKQVCHFEHLIHNINIYQGAQCSSCIDYRQGHDIPVGLLSLYSIIFISFLLCRDLAQGSFRMRGLVSLSGAFGGQTIHMFIIPGPLLNEIKTASH